MKQNKTKLNKKQKGTKDNTSRSYYYTNKGRLEDIYAEWYLGQGTKIYYDNSNETKHLKRLLKHLNKGDKILLDSISSIAPSFDVLIKTLYILDDNSVDISIEQERLGLYEIFDSKTLLLLTGAAIQNKFSIQQLPYFLENVLDKVGRERQIKRWENIG